MTALIIVLTVGMLISGALALGAYMARSPRSLTPDEWRRGRTEEGAATLLAAVLWAADAAEAALRWLAPRRRKDRP